MESACCVPSKTRDSVFAQIDDASEIEIDECLRFLHAWEKTRERSGAELRIRRRKKSHHPIVVNDNIVTLQYWCTKSNVRAELPVWKNRLFAWRTKSTFDIGKVIAETVLYRSYEDRELLGPMDVIKFLRNSTYDSIFENMLLRGTVIHKINTLEAARLPHHNPAWSSAIISNHPGLSELIPWDDFIKQNDELEDVTRPPIAPFRSGSSASCRVASTKSNCALIPPRPNTCPPCSFQTMLRPR